MRKKKTPRNGRPAPMKPPDCIQLDARMTIVQAASLHGSLLTHLAAGGPIAIDGSRVEEIDTAILQLLASLWRTAKERDRPSGPAPPMRCAVRRIWSA